MRRYYIDDKEVDAEFFVEELKRMKGYKEQVIDYLLAGLPVNVQDGNEKHEFKIKNY